MDIVEVITMSKTRDFPLDEIYKIREEKFNKKADLLRKYSYILKNNF